MRERTMGAESSRIIGRPPAGFTHIGVRLPPADLRVLDAFIEAQPDPKPSRPEAIRRMVAECLQGKGYLDAEAPKAERESF
jgi:hypothetical protein